MNKIIFSLINKIFLTHKINHTGFAKTGIFVLTILALHSCFPAEEEIPWDVKGHSPMLVVDGGITNELKRQGIRLLLSTSYFAKDNPGIIHGASVRVGDGTNNFVFTEDTAGWYFSNEPFAGETGKTYTLLVTLPEVVNGRKEYTASSIMPEGIDLDSIMCEIYALPEIYRDTEEAKKDTTILFVLYFGYEPPSAGNYYYAKMYRNANPLFSNIKGCPFTDDSERNGSYINAAAVIKNVVANDTITFELFSTNKQFYNYIDAVSKMDFTGNIYSPSGPPANAASNVDGALGFFNVTYVSRKTSVAIDKR